MNLDELHRPFVVGDRVEVNTGGYGKCGPGCVLGPFCGDGIQQPESGEDCDVGPSGDGLRSNCRYVQIR